MDAVVEIPDEPTPDGWPWLVWWRSGREDSGTAPSYGQACVAVGEALDRERSSRVIHSYFDGSAF